MNTWYKFILNALFYKKREDKDWETTDKCNSEDTGISCLFKLLSN